MPYDELVKRLRDDEAWKNCDFDFIYGWMHESADAIEELTALSRRQEVELVELTGELASKTRWIPVTERLPEPYMSVLLYSGEKLYTGYMHSDKRFTVNDSRFPDRPTHWMPLPQVPEEEQA